MAHQMLKPYSFLFYLLSIITSFFVGLSYAGFIDAGKNQGLAGGAIVLGYGVVAAGIGLIIALFVANRATRKSIFRLNMLLALAIAAFFVYFRFQYSERQKAREENSIGMKAKETYPVLMTSLVHVENESISGAGDMDLGMFSPDISDRNALYLYGNLNLEKPISEHLPTDSITFLKREIGDFDIKSAPPYLVPEHMKLDYNILYFKAISITNDFVEIEVNKSSNQTAFVSKESGKLMYWPDFFLHVNSVEFMDPATQNVYVKPLDYAGTVNQSYSFMRPLRVKENWMNVLLLNDNQEASGKGWIKWHQDGKLLIQYSLLS